MYKNAQIKKMPIKFWECSYEKTRPCLDNNIYLQYLMEDQFFIIFSKAFSKKNKTKSGSRNSEVFHIKNE